MRRKGWLMDFVCPAYLHFRGRNHCSDILPGTGGDPGRQHPSGGARAFNANPAVQDTSRSIVRPS